MDISKDRYYLSRMKATNSGLEEQTYEDSKSSAAFAMIEFHERQAREKDEIQQCYKMYDKIGFELLYKFLSSVSSLVAVLKHLFR